MRCLHDLLGAERDEHADDDDADFAGKLAPAVQGLGYLDAHQ